jgi:prepilin-type N-terminal cleavage/methylation domain-containing protein
MTPIRQPQGYSKQHGFTLLELLGVLAVMAVGSYYLALELKDYVQGTRNAADGAIGVQVTNAVSQYMSVPTTQQFIATQGMPYTISLAALQSPTIYLNPAYNTTNSAGQTPAIRVTKAADGSLQVFIVWTGGQAIKDGALDDITAYMVKGGAPGGAIESTAPTSAIGFNGSWTINPASFGLAPGAGHMASFLTYSATGTVDDALHRDVTPGQPQYQTMNAAINMNGNALNNVSDVHMQAANQGMTFFGGGEKVYGTADYGIAFQTNYALRAKIFNDGHMENYSYFSVPGGGNGLLVGGSAFYGDSTNMALRPAANGGTVYLQGTAGGGGTANLYVTGTAYVASTITGGGDISAGGAVYANNWFRSYGNTGWYNQNYGGGWYMSDGTWVRSYNDKYVYTGGVMYAAGGLWTGNGITFQAATAYQGNGCGGSQLTASTDGTGQLVQCKSGVWRTLGGYSSVIQVAGPSTYYWDSVATCPGGYTLLGGGAVGGWQNGNNSLVGSAGGNFLFGMQSYPSGNSWHASTTSNQAAAQAIAICAQ